MKVNGFKGEGFDPKDWHVDLQTDYVTHFPTDLGFSVGYLPRDLGSGGLSIEDFVAEPVHFPAWGDVPSDEELARLCQLAAYLFAVRFLARQKSLAARDLQHPFINEGSIHDEEACLDALPCSGR